MDGDYGSVEAITVTDAPQRMYNLTVADAHTYFVGDGQWLVHNCRLNDQYSNVQGPIQNPMTGMGAGSGRLDEMPPYGHNWQNQSSTKTLGILEIDGQSIYLQSGNIGPSASMPIGTPGMNGTIKSHVEAHTASIMRLEDVNEAVLYINQAPCPGKTGCGHNLPFMLPEGSALTVIAPNDYKQRFIGTP